MRVILAGATGTLGGVLVPELIRQGHDVVGISRTPGGARSLADAGASSLVADVLDRRGLLAAARGLEADAVIHQLTALKKAPVRHKDMTQTDVLRTTGSTHLLELAGAVGATRFVTQSIVFGYGYGDHGRTTLTEDSPFGLPAGTAFDPHTAAMLSAERQAFTTHGIDGIALRYGLFYGADAASVAEMLRRRALPVAAHGGELAFVHHEDAASATVAALERGTAGAAYNIVDDTPMTFRQMIELTARATGSPRPLVLPRWLMTGVAPYGGAVMGKVSMHVSNAAAKADLGWRPRYPDVAAGLAATRSP